MTARIILDKTIIIDDTVLTKLCTLALLQVIFHMCVFPCRHWVCSATGCIRPCSCLAGDLLSPDVLYSSGSTASRATPGDRLV